MKFKIKHVWQRCYCERYGRDSALVNGHDTYCLCGDRFYTHNNRRDTAAPKCHDWPRCNGLNSVTNKITR